MSISDISTEKDLLLNRILNHLTVSNILSAVTRIGDYDHNDQLIWKTITFHRFLSML